MIPNWNVWQTPLRNDTKQSDLEKVRNICKTFKEIYNLGNESQYIEKQTLNKLEITEKQ